MYKPLLSLVLLSGIIACGETVNYETREKLLVAAVASGDAQNQIESTLPDAEGDGADQSIAQVKCAGREWIVQNEQLVFPELSAGTTCDFGQGEMLSRKDGFLRAYLRQNQTLTLPEGAILCGFELTHREQAMHYDDEMFFLLQDQILMATKDYTEYFTSQDLFRRFDWEKLKDKIYDQFDPRGLYCLGGAEGFSTCDLPPTDTSGSIHLQLTAEMSEKLAVFLGRERKLNFSWITTGDNDSSDCRHSPIALDVKLQYVLD